MPDQRPERFQRHGGAVLATPVEHGRRAFASYRAGERAQHGRLADPRLALHDDRPHARRARQRRLRRQQLELAGSPDHGRPPDQFGLQRQPVVPGRGRRRRLLGPVPAGRDPLLDPAHLGGWFGSGPLGEVGPVLTKRGQRVGLAPGAAERLDQQAPRPVPQGMHRDVRPEPGDRLRPPPRTDQLGGVVLDRRRVQLGEPGRLGPGPVLGRELLERRARPQRQGPFERPDPVVIGPEPGQQGGEQGGVDRDRETIATLRRDDRGVSEALAQSRHNRAQRAGRNPEHVTEQIHPQRARGVHGQPGQ